MVGFTAAMDVFMEEQPLHHDVTRTELGARVETTIFGDVTHKTITPRSEPFGTDYSSMNDFIKDISAFHKQHDEKILQGTYTNEPVYTCGDRAPLDKNGTEMIDILPAFAAELTPAKPSGTYEGNCFEHILMEYVPVNAT